MTNKAGRPSGRPSAISPTDWRRKLARERQQRRRQALAALKEVKPPAPKEKKNTPFIPSKFEPLPGDTPEKIQRKKARDAAVDASIDARAIHDEAVESGPHRTLYDIRPVPVPETPLSPDEVATADTAVYLSDVTGGARGIDASYEIVEASEALPSHDPHTFAPTEGYPPELQERDYSQPYEQLKVIRNTQSLIPAYLVTDNPDSVNGPPVVNRLLSPGGELLVPLHLRPLVVLGGNSRFMSLARAYKEGTASDYRDYLTARLQRFGLGPKDLEGVKEPVLVRRLNKSLTLEEAAPLSRRLNEAQTQELDRSTDAVSLSHRLSDDTLEIMAEGADASGTLHAYLTSTAARPFVRSLTRSGIIEQRNSGLYLQGADLTEAGQEMVARVVSARIVPNAAIIERLGPARRMALARSAPALIAARRAGYDVGPALQRAAEELAEKESRGIKTLTDFDAQMGLFPSRPPLEPEARALRDALDRGPRHFVEVVREFSSRAVQQPTDQGGLFGPPPTAAELLSPPKK